MIATCKVCGVHFFASHRLAEICDWVCRSENMTRKNRRHKKLPLLETVRQQCAWCADDFFGAPNQQHCSEQCQKEDTEHADHQERQPAVGC